MVCVCPNIVCLCILFSVLRVGFPSPYMSKCPGRVWWPVGVTEGTVFVFEMVSVNCFVVLSPSTEDVHLVMSSLPVSLSCQRDVKTESKAFE